jgi:hypothetical protein
MYLPSEIRNLSSKICPVVLFFCPEPAGDTRIPSMSNKIKCECNEEIFGVALNSPREKKIALEMRACTSKDGTCANGKK